MKKYQREWEENKKTLKNNPELLELLSELNDAKLLKTQSTTRYNSLRGKIGDILKKGHYNKVFSLNVGLQVTISTMRHRRQYKFNEEKFKADHPELYKKYLESTPYLTYGGQLTVKAIDERSLEYYQEFESGGY